MNKDYSVVLNRILITLIIIATILGLNLIVDTVSLSNKKEEEKVEETLSEDNSYDVSMFNQVNISSTLELFDKKGTSVLYLGRATCGACVSFLPTLKTLQNELNYTTNYLDIETVSQSDANFSKFLAKLDTEITENINGEEKTDKMSAFYGYTPMVIIIKDGIAVDASVGAYSESNFRKFLNQNGIK